MKSLVIMVTAFLCLSGKASAYEWKPVDGFEGWRFSNVSRFQPTAEGVLIFKQTGSSEFWIATPEKKIGSERSVRIRVRTMGTEAQVACVFRLRGKQAWKVLPIFDGKKWKELYFDFTEDLPGDVSVDRVLFVFGSTEPVEVKDIRIYSPSFSDVFLSQGLRAYNVNFLYPFTLYRYSLNLWFYGVIMVSGICLALFATLKRRRGAFAVVGAIILCCFLLNSLREAFEEFTIIDTTYEDFLSAAPGEKRYHYWSDLVDFATFIHDNNPAWNKTVSVFSDEYAYYLLRYLLYPLTVTQRQEGDSLGRINAFYNVDVRAEGNILTEKGKPVAEGGWTIPYSHTSFLYIWQ